MGTIDREAERELERLRVAFEGTGDGLWDLDVETGALWISAGLRRLIGGDAEGLMMERPRALDRIHPDDVLGAQAAAEPVLAGRAKHFAKDVRLWHLSGYWLWMTIRGTVLAHNPDGTARRLVGTLKDIDDRKQLEIQNAVLLKLSDVLLRSQDAGSMLQASLDVLGEHYRASRVCYADIDDDAAQMSIRHEWSDGTVPSVLGTWPMSDFEYGKEAQVRSGATVCIPDILTDPRTNHPHILAAYEPYRVRSVLVMPMIRNGRFEAILFLHSSTPRVWTKADIQLAELARTRIWDAVIRDQAEARLRESEARLSSIFEVTPTIPWVVDPEGTPLLMGANWTPTTGLTMEEAGRDGWANAVHPDDRNAAVATIVGCRASGEPMDVRYRMRAKDKSFRWCRLQGAATRGPDGQIVQWAGYISDIHEQVEAELALKASEEAARATADLLKQIIETTDDPVWAVDLDRRYRMVNSAAAQVMGVNPTDMIGKHMRDILPADFIETALEQIDRVERGESLVLEEWRLDHAKGAVRLFEHSKVPLRTADGRITGSVGIARDITESRAADEALRASEAAARRTAALLDQVLETSPDAIWAIDQEGRYLMANSATSRIVGESRDAVLGQRVTDLLPEEFQAASVGQIERIADGAEVHVEELIFDKSQGQFRMFDSRKVPLRGADGEIRGIVGISRDITERKEAEKALLASEAAARETALLLELILETTPDPIWVVGKDHRYLRISKATANVLGVGRDEVRGRLPEEILQPEFAPTVREEQDRIFQGEEIALEEKLFVAGRHEMRLFDSRKVPLRKPDGEIIGMVGVARDITERKEVEVRLQAIVDTAVDAIVVIDESGRIASANPATFTLFGYTESEMVGRSIGMVMPHEHAANHHAYIGHYLTTGERRIIGVGRQVMGLRKDGTSIPVDLSIAEWFDTNGKRHFTGIMRDVTARLEAEGRLRRAQDTLLSVSRLSAAGAMASTLAHELNQPLTASSNLLRSARRMLERGHDTGKVTGLLEEASTEVLRAGAIIRRMREYTVNGELEPARHRLTDLAESALAMVQRRPEAKGVTIDWALDPAVDAVLADRVQIEQVIANLLRNAMEAMKDSAERRIEIETASQGDHAALHVHDTGHGIPAEQMERLFQPFATTKDSGTGLGLAICRTIVEAHGGQIFANNRPGGGGATFTITLPVAPMAQERTQKAEA